MKIHSKYFFKYRTWQKPQDRILVNNEIYFASIDQFNDPFDCRIPIRFDQLTRVEKLEKLLDLTRMRYPDVHEDKAWQVTKSLIDDPEYKGQKFFEKMWKSQVDTISKTVGVFSITNDRKNIVMWSHYADSHKGICVGFDILKLTEFFKNKEEETGTAFSITPVQYDNKFPFISARALGTGKVLKKILATKSNAWNYEKEYRVIMHGFTRQKVSLPYGIMTCVILGCESNADLQKEVISVLMSRKDKLNLYKTKIKELSFGLEFEEINY